MRYLKGTKTLGLTFSAGKADGLLHGYCDADWPKTWCRDALPLASFSCFVELR